MAIDLSRVYGIKGHGADAKRRQVAEAAQRAKASNILDPADVAGEYDAARLLFTTLGGQIRPITLDDLRQFQHLASKLGKRYKGGITAKGAVESSRKEDRDRANSQIKTAVVVSAKAGVLHFVTNAGPDSDAVRHHVHVGFPTFKAFASSPYKPDGLARKMLDGPLQYDCDCGRHRYWYRYIATRGGFAFGRPETGYPKIRNPKLIGVACKHVLRVMAAVMKDGNVKARAAAMIAAAQGNDQRLQATTAAEAKAIAQQQAKSAHHLKNKVETTAEKAERATKTPAGRARAIAAAAAEAKRRADAAEAKQASAVKAAFSKIGNMPMTKETRDRLIALLQSRKTID